ncbi:type III secretion system protein SepQ [Citrobacter rodentium]|uniref:T3SS structural protein SepQ n=2 Tax=Citrobacter rodentium TaxID=67825 RepID=D2TKF2_CITRI|nr:type III secretion system protein SepQ [Citrobacter rodentium]KIQ51450.1 SepQ [Citrobacter rodentium]QBY29426.1 type III secretion system protein SepQ [Citrobacter rodentium]UHO33176.1 type III secretion system protein SepQ [Citrobacter rodentium NBRC 105723 = DSM 16636]CBG89722.1 T3SS structural protein SepQ [Citrobacter rodentium ICC168]HAT8015394.1 type III secretion system protein SepQ [Citrobacter rodentium NBRC 105723 = DSM 16636]
MKPLNSQSNMKINDFYLPLLPVIGIGRLYITSEGHACHAYFREVSGNGFRFTLAYSGYEGCFWVSEEQLIQWCHELFPYSDSRLIPEDTIKLMLLWAIHATLPEDDASVDDVQFTTLNKDIYPVIENNNGKNRLNVIILETTVQSLQYLINDNWQLVPHSNTLFFDGYIAPGWTDYPITKLSIGDSLRLYHVDDSQERKCWLVINNPLATVKLSDNNLSVTDVQAADPLCIISNETVMNRIYCAIGTINVDIHKLRNLKKDDTIGSVGYHLFGGGRLIRNNTIIAYGTIIKINEDFYFNISVVCD